MSTSQSHPNVAVVGAGVAGAACAAGLHQAGARVTLFEKSSSLGGRMATRRASWIDDGGFEQLAEFDHGTQHFTARNPRFRARVGRALQAGAVADWRPRVHSSSLAPQGGTSYVAVPSAPALCRYLLADLQADDALVLDQAVQRLHRDADGWHVVTAGEVSTGPFDQVLLAMPPGQAALLLAGHHDAWADALAVTPMQPCWTLMAATDDVDWPWDAAEPSRGPLAWVARNDRKPGRRAPSGAALWVAQATTVWSTEHLEDDPADVAAALGEALKALLPCASQPRWHHASAQRWRYALPSAPPPDARECWWDAALGLGVCGDFLCGGDVEGAWRSGDELADTVSAWLETEQETVQLA